MKQFLENWKTTTIGFIILSSVVMMFLKIITMEQFVVLLGALGGLGLTFSSDSKDNK